MEAVDRNWEDLPQELLRLIAKKLPDICDFIHFRAVCKTWHSSISADNMPPQFPWIRTIYTRGHGRFGPDMEFYSITSKKVYSIYAPISSDKRVCVRAIGGYLFARQFGNTSRFSLLNPLHNSEIILPGLATARNVLPFGAQCFGSEDYVVCIENTTKLFVCKVGDKKWDCIRLDYIERWWNRYFYLKNLLFFVCKNNDGMITKVFDIGSRKVAYVIPDPKDEKISTSGPFFVESCGEILRVCCSYSKRTDYKFDIHRLEFKNHKGDPCWVKVRSIGDQILFLNLKVYGALCASANGFAGFKGNCIYFINNVEEEYCVSMYDIENGSTTLIDYPFDRGNIITWFLPTLNHI